MTSYWFQNSIIYHLFPLGLAGAPPANHTSETVENNFGQIYPWIVHAKSLGANVIFLGPVFESSTHGYDTRDFYNIDRRLGNNSDFENFASAVKQQGMQLVIDAVFNHVGREFWAFRDVLEKGEQSAYTNWFENLHFGTTSPKGDPFGYEAWQGHYDLVKLNLANPDVRKHIFDAVRMWMDMFKIDGLRLDAADCIDFDFLRALRDFVKARRSDFWLMGEVVHGDYRRWANPATLDSVTNYACYKGLYSSLNDGNYFEIAHTLNDQFGERGHYKDLYLYNFVDNHDVDRVASKLHEERHLYPLYLLLYTLPGIPSIYYGSEWGIQGKKGEHTDAPLRPKLVIDDIKSPHPDLLGVISKLGEIRKGSTALRQGDFKILFVNHQQLAFSRQTLEETMVVILNSSFENIDLNLALPGQETAFIDLINPGERFNAHDGQLQIPLQPSWGRILKSVR